MLVSGEKYVDTYRLGAMINSPKVVTSNVFNSVGYPHLLLRIHVRLAGRYISGDNDSPIRTLIKYL